MKVLFLSTHYRFGRSLTADALRLEKLRCAIQQHGIETDFISLRENPVRRPVMLQPLNLPFLHKRIADCDFIHAGNDAAYIAALWKDFTRARVIYDVHGDTLSEAQLNYSLNPGLVNACLLVQALIVNNIAYRHADYYLAVSKLLQQRLITEKNIPEHRICLVRNGVELELFTRPPNNPIDDFLVCYSGGFQSWQAIDNLVSAFELIPEDHIKLRIIGFTESDVEIKNSIAMRLGNRVELVDRVNQKELISQLAGAHVFVIPRFKHRATEVAFPTKFSEYLALGKPVIVCNVDETAHMVRECHCGLVSEPSPEALAETIREASILTQAELNQMGQNARRQAEGEFSWHDIGRKYVDLLIKWGTPE